MKVETRQFLDVTRPLLEQGDASALAEAVTRRWSTCQLCGLLRSSDVDVRRTAAVVVGLVGGPETIECLCQSLHDEDGQVNRMAEHGLWAIWFRACQPEAAEPFERGVSHLEAERYGEAIEAFHEAAERDPDFAEAYNQSAIAHFLEGEMDSSIADCQAALKRMPCHFGAMAGLGHAYTEQGRLGDALRCYRRALAIHPRMTGVRRALRKLEDRRAAELGDSSLTPVTFNRSRG